jgi:hypothetical protein
LHVCSMKLFENLPWQCTTAGQPHAHVVWYPATAAQQGNSRRVQYILQVSCSSTESKLLIYCKKAAHLLRAEAGHILYLRILYPIHIQAKKRILYPITITAKKGYGYIPYILYQKFCQHCHSFLTTKSQTW